MRIAHVSDIHIRNLRYHDEYRRAFDDLYRDLRSVKPDLIVNTGDTVHAKIQLSPELVQICSEHVRSVAEIAPYHIILGNHDLNLMNPDRQDAISPIVASIGANTKHPVCLHKQSGLFCVEADDTVFSFWVFSLADQENYPRPEMWKREKDHVNIGLFHGSVMNCVTDLEWKMISAEVDLLMFDGLDFVMMGDIHRQQFFRDRRIAYAGSLIQQNFGEDQTKGYLLWDIGKDGTFDVQFRKIIGSRGFYTVRLDDELLFQRKLSIPDGARLRIVSPRNLSLVEQKDVERSVRDAYRPYDIVSVTSPSTSYRIDHKKKAATKKDLENISSPSVQEKLIRQFFKDRDVSNDVVDLMLDLDKRFGPELAKDESITRNVFWKVNRIGWSNLFNYGMDNFIDFSSIPGVTGIFAPNASGKSSIFDVFLETLFDKVTKDVSKNIELINDNRESAVMVADILVGDESYVIERRIERIKYGQRKLQETKEWGKTSLDFYLDDDGERTSMNGVSRPETEATIRRKIGTFDDFALAAMSAQIPISGIPGGADMINCKETDRKKILCRFLDLDIFEQKCNLAKDEAKRYSTKLQEYESADIEHNLQAYRKKKLALVEQIEAVDVDVSTGRRSITRLDRRLVELRSSLVDVERAVDIDETIRELAQAHGSLESVCGEKEDLEADISRLEELYNRAVVELASFDVVAIAAGLIAAKALEKDIAFVDRDVEKLRSTLAIDKKKLKLLDEVPCGDLYPSCKFLVDAFGAKRGLSSVEARCAALEDDLRRKEAELIDLQDWEEKSEKLEIARKDLSELVATVAMTKLRLENISLKEDRLKKKIDQLVLDEASYRKGEDTIRRNDEARRAIRELEGDRRGVDRKVQDSLGSIADLNKRLGADCLILERLEEDAKQLTDVRRLCHAYELYVEAMGKYGIAYRILAEKLPMINDEINKILSNIVDFNVFLEHDPDEQTIRLYLQYGEYKRRNLGLACGAEKFIASLAVRAALLNVSSLPRSNVFIVDEGFGKLDPIHLEAVGKMFDYLRTLFDHVIVISHVDTLKDLVDNSVEISVDADGYAHVCVA